MSSDHSWLCAINLLQLCQTGLFSATVVAFLIEGYIQLQPSSSDTVTLLVQISRQFAALCWFFCLYPIRPARSGFSTINLSRPREHIMVHQSCLELNVRPFGRAHATVGAPISPNLSALVRSLQACSDASLLRRRCRAIRSSNCCRGPPALLRVSAFLFFAGLVDFLISINHTVAVFLLSAWWSECQHTSYLHSPSSTQTHHTKTPLTTLLWIFQ